MLRESVAEWKNVKGQNVSSTTDPGVFQTAMQIWHVILAKLEQGLQPETQFIFWVTVLINNRYLSTIWIQKSTSGFLHHLKFHTACSFSVDIFSLEEPQHFAVTVPGTSLLALGPDKLLLNACLYYS